MSVRIAILVITAIFRLSVSESQPVLLMPRGRQFSVVKEPGGSNSFVTVDQLQTFIGIRTVISCAALCSQLPRCNSFSYKVIEQVCHVSDIDGSQYTADDNRRYYQSSETASRNGVKASAIIESTPQFQTLKTPFATAQQSIASVVDYSPETYPYKADSVAELVTLTTKHVSGSTESSTVSSSSSLTPKQTSTAISKSQITSPASTLKFTSAVSPKTPSLFVSALKQTSTSSPETRTSAASTLKFRYRPTSTESSGTLSTTRILTTASISATTSAGKIPPDNCSFPFTLGGALNYKCVPGNYSPELGCFVDNRVWLGCLPPLDFQAQNTTLQVTIEERKKPVPLMSVHGWIIISQRIDGSVSFNRNWDEYKKGFGSLTGAASNFWVGNEKLNFVTKNRNCKLRAEFQFSQTGGWYSAEYSSFVVDSEAQGYMLHLAGYSGDAGDSLIRSDQYGADGMKFTTPDVDNDLGKENNCGTEYPSGWWMNQCCKANLNGIYEKGMHWDSIVDDLGLLEDSTLLVARMMIKIQG